MRFLVLRLLTLCSVGVIAVNTAASNDNVEFYNDIAPLFSKNCVACHNANQSEGGLNLEDYAALMQGGDSGDSIVAKELDASYLLARVNGQEEPIMPPEDNSVGARRLNEAELKLLEKWIQSGALEGKAKPDREMNWQALPGNLQPIYAVATSSDGQFLAFGHGSQLLVLPQRGQNSGHIESLVDDDLNPTSSETVPDRAHLDIVQSVAISPDSQRIASGGFRSLKIWKREQPARRLLTGLTTKASTALASPDGQQLACLSESAGLEIADLSAGTVLRFLSVDSSTIAAAAWIDEIQLLIGSKTGVWRIVDVAAQEIKSASTSHAILPIQLTRAGDDRLIAIDDAGQLLLLKRGGDADNSLFDVQIVPGPGQACRLAVDESEPALVAVACTDNRVHILDVATGKTQRSFDTDLQIDGLLISHASNRLIAYSDSVARMWNLEDGGLITDFSRDYLLTRQVDLASRSLSRQQSRIEQLKLRLPELQKAADKEQEAKTKLEEAREKAAAELASRQQEREKAATDVASLQTSLTAAQAALEAAKKKVESVAADLEAKKKALTAANDKESNATKELEKKDQALAAASDSAERAALRIPALKQTMQEEENHLSSLQAELDRLHNNKLLAPTNSVAFSHDQEQVVIAGEDQVLRVFASSDGEALANLSSPDRVAALVPATVARQVDSANTVTQAGLTHASGVSGLTSDGQLFAWTLREVWRMERSIGNYNDSPFSDRVTALAFSPDGQSLAVGSGPPSRFGDISLISLADGNSIQDLGQVHSDSVLALAFSPDGRVLASAGADKMCQLLDLKSGERLRSFEGHTHHVLGLAWRDDGQVLATASADATIKLWKADSAEQIRTIAGFPQEVTAIRFLGASPQLLSTCADGRVRLYDSNNGKQIRAFSGANDALFGVAISTDGQRVYAGGQAGEVLYWNVKDAKLLGRLSYKPDGSGDHE